MAIKTYREALNEAHREEMLRDESVFVLGEEVAEYEGAFKVTEGLLKEFGEKRVIDTPIAEEAIVGLAIGSAMVGLRPIAEMMTINFAMLAMDQIVNHASKLRYMSGGQVSVPIVIRAPGGAGRQLGAQHSQSLEAWFMHVPGLKVVTPSTPGNAKGLLKTSIRDDNPVLFIEHEMCYMDKGEVPEGEYTVPFGVADVRREGADITIIGYSRMANLALDAAEELEKDGVSAEVIDARTLRPLDLETMIESVKKTGRAVIVEECWRTCGVGSEIASSLYEAAFDYFDAPMGRAAGEDVPMPYAKNLEDMAVPTVDSIVRVVEETLR